MQALPSFEAFARASPSAFNHIKFRKPPCFVPFSSKRRSCLCSFMIADKCQEHAKKGKQLSGHIHLKHFGGTNDMEFRCINGTTSMDLADKKCGCFLVGKIRDSITGQCVSTSLKDNSNLLHDFRFVLKMAFLIGIPTFQTSELAIASPEIASGVQPLSFFGDLGDINTGFASAFLLIFFSELGDKTFFIAALLAARNSSVIVFAGTFGALAAMTIVSVVIGRTFHYVDDIFPFRLGETDFPIDDFAAVCLLIYFGVITLLDAASGDELKIKEEQEEAEIAISELQGNGAGIMAAASTVITTFLLVFVAEWGDKSFFSTIALAAASSPLGVIGGALAGHAFATVLAVLGGSLLGTYFSEKVIAYIGGILFLIFAGVTLAEIIT